MAAALLLVTILVAGMTGDAVAQPGDLPQLGPRAAPTTHVQVGALPMMDTIPAFDEAAATNTAKDGLELHQVRLPQDFQANGALASDDVGVVERRDGS